jgi:hypothetical protein
VTSLHHARRPGRAARRRAAATTAVTLLALVLAVAGCSSGSDVSKVTVTAGSATVVLPAALSCVSVTGATALSCAGGDNDATAPHLTVAPGTPLTVQVPTSVGNTPWVIVFSYTDSNGKQQGDRTAVFPPQQRYSYQLTPPAGAQMTRLEVQSLTAAPAPSGGVDFPAIGTWVLLIDPIGGAPTTSTSSTGARE